MGFEEATPPIPGRKQEIEAMAKLQSNWLNQSYIRGYMNEDVRMAKIAYADRVNKVRKDFYGNCLLYGLLLLPVAYWSRRLFVARGGLPITNTPNNFERVRSDAQIKLWEWGKWALPGWIFATTFISFKATDFGPSMDKNYDYVQKPVRLF